MRTSGLAIACLLASATPARADGVSLDTTIANTPPEIVEAGQRHDVWTHYRIGGAPSLYLRGDFDGDRRPDHAVVVTARSDGEHRLVILWGKKSKKPAWAPAGKLPAGDWGFWYVHPRDKQLPATVDGARRPKLKGEALVVVASSEHARIIYWTGKKLAEYAIEAEYPGDGNEPDPSPWR